MPVAGFPDFQACEAHFAQDPNVDDAAALCAYIEQRGKEEDVADGNEAIFGLDVEYMSFVDTPAVDSVFLKRRDRAQLRGMETKDRHGRKMKSKSMNIEMGQGMFLKSELDDKNYVVKAVALIPDVVDGNGEFVSKEEIYRAAIKFMEHQKVDSQHDFEEGKGDVVFNWILEEDRALPLMHGGVKEYPEGTWIVGTKVKDPKEWELIKDGTRKGFSIAGYWSGVPVQKPEAETKDRVYIDKPSNAPEGANVQQGPQGGHYYDTGPGGKPLPEPKPVKPKTPAKVAKENVSKRREESADAVKKDPKNEKKQGYFDGVNEASKAKNFTDVKKGANEAFKEWDKDKSPWGSEKVQAYKDVMMDDYGISNKDALAIIKGDKKELKIDDLFNSQSSSDKKELIPQVEEKDMEEELKKEIADLVVSVMDERDRSKAEKDKEDEKAKEIAKLTERLEKLEKADEEEKADETLDETKDEEKQDEEEDDEDKEDEEEEDEKAEEDDDYEEMEDEEEDEEEKSLEERQLEEKQILRRGTKGKQGGKSKGKKPQMKTLIREYKSDLTTKEE